MRIQDALKTTLLAGLLSVPLALQAQTEGEAEADDGLGRTYTAETHGAWEVRCIRVEEGEPEPCQMYQLLSDQNGNAVAEFNVFDLPDEGEVVAGATIVTPLDTLLPPGLRLRVDESQWAEYPFAFCQQVGCFARLGLTGENIETYKGGGEAFVAIVPLPAPDQIVELTASLSGFTAAFTSLEERNAAIAAAAE